MLWNTQNLRSSGGHVETAEEEGCKTNSEKGHGTLGRKQQKMWGRWRGGSEEEKEKEQQEKEQQRSCGVSQRKSKVRPFSQRGRTSAQERPAKPDTGAVAAATTNESSFTFSDGKNGGKAEKLEQFIYQFTSVPCFFYFYFNYCILIRHSVSSLMNILIIFLPHPLWIRSIPSPATKRQIQSEPTQKEQNVDSTRFPEISRENIEELKAVAVNKNTSSSTKQWMNVLKSWCQFRHLKNVDITSRGGPL